MVKTMLKAGDRLAARFLPKAEASACTPGTSWLTNCYCADRGNHTGERYCDYHWIDSGCNEHVVYGDPQGPC
ncbi:hypothetical protein GCM10009839_08280 [Catenulispora yoronensis]|uniref:Uncharacterized protein n=1 Tax=Catenulispora yoronensis TaxID=450799 RepID=A0ABP5F3T5_9ACTN